MWHPPTLLVTDSNLGAAAFERLSAIADNLTWFCWVYDDREQRNEIVRQIELGRWDLAISFYSDLIVPPSALDHIRLPLNIHPALPLIRGVGHDVIPLVEKHSTVGATLHRMAAVVNSGEIYEVLEAPLSPRQTYHSLREFNQSLCLEMLDRLCERLAEIPNVDALELDFRSRAAKVQHRWGKYHSRLETTKLREEMLRPAEQSQAQR